METIGERIIGDSHRDRARQLRRRLLVFRGLYADAERELAKIERSCRRRFGSAALASPEAPLPERADAIETLLDARLQSKGRV
jgi:hypothetical protein